MPRAPTAAELALIDPDGSFRQRLLRDRENLLTLAEQGASHDLETLVHRLAGAAATFGYNEIGGIALKLDDAFTASRVTGTAAPDVAPLANAIAEALASRS
jgi:HPt (histidine-containing phosphotransfer) domain-containing protein